MKKSLLSIAVLAVALTAPVARAAEWSDTSLHLWYGTAFAEPGVGNFATNEAQNVEKTILSFTHASGYKYGSNFFNIDMLYSDTHDPVQGQAVVTSVGSLEVYTVYRHTLSFSKISGSKVGFGPVKDIGFEFGADLNTKNNSFASRKVMPIAGLSFSIDIPGFLNIGIMANKEWNTNGLLFRNADGTVSSFQPKRSVEFDVTPMLTAAWFYPVYGPLSFEGFGSVNFPKGKDGAGADTKTEVLLHPKLMVDVGSLVGAKGIQVGAGFQYWLNKFGNLHTDLPGSYEKVLFGEIAYHL
jgi:nucleoside-specific outer membrane channel protein Tsx